jgi:zinc D-Ala-D-Ala dipeptidase
MDFTMCARALPIAIAFVTGLTLAKANELPEGFVYLRDMAPSIIQDMRYATPQNITGKPVPGYEAGECLLQRAAAEALECAQEKAQQLGYSLMVYDCYRPKRAVQAFLAWAAQPGAGESPYYFPHLQKSQLVPGYIAPQSSHSTGASIDVTLVPSGSAAGKGSPPKSDCASPASDRGQDGSIDMGTSFDCFDPKANTASPSVQPEQRKARMLLKSILEPAGFQNYAAEWWHFTYTRARDKKRYNFPIVPRPSR